MSLSKTVLKSLKFLLTLGGSFHYAKAAREYDDIYNRYSSVFDDIAPLNKQIELTTLQIEGNIDSLKTYMKSRKTLLGVDDYVPNLSNGTQDPVKALELINTNHNLVANTVSSSALSLATVGGAWLSVGAFGTASTGAAISGLSGAAASNATLAWFGFGSLASGGLGMAGGQAILIFAGIALTWGIVAYTAYSKSKKIVKQNAQVLGEIDRLQELLPLLRREAAKLKTLGDRVGELTTQYLTIAKHLESEVYPYGLLSRFKQKVFSSLGIRPYSSKQQAAVTKLQTETRELLEKLSSL